MSEAKAVLASVAVIALTFGITGPTIAPVDTEEPLSTKDILIATNDTAAETGQIEESAQEPAKMGKQEGTQEGDNLGATPESYIAKVDQPPHRNPTTDNTSGGESGSQ
jgi:hypothetical protein